MTVLVKITAPTSGHHVGADDESVDEQDRTGSLGFGGSLSWMMSYRLNAEREGRDITVTDLSPMDGGTRHAQAATAARKEEVPTSLNALSDAYRVAGGVSRGEFAPRCRLDIRYFQAEWALHQVPFGFQSRYSGYNSRCGFDIVCSTIRCEPSWRCRWRRCRSTKH